MQLLSLLLKIFLKTKILHLLANNLSSRAHISHPCSEVESGPKASTLVVHTPSIPFSNRFARLASSSDQMLIDDSWNINPSSSEVNPDRPSDRTHNQALNLMDVDLVGNWLT
ncbi:hypothetical protein FRX31_003214 [Thalictrum thalictroides]|uniref:Uncharacterized protein n=1 Tax=Thalictrum thalictroides TaxID=46969 RepID=A0A7J6XFN1_THATH|nr:hypothetical protein FRX31_003214 [Thalictrum thalictroides]